MPRSRAIERRVHVVHRPVGAALEGAVQRGHRQQPRVVVGEAAVRRDHDLVGLAVGELHREAAELRGERDVRAERLELLRADHGDVHRVRHEPAVERRGDLLGDDHAGAVLRLVGRGREVRRDDDVVELEQRARVGLRREDVERCARDLAGLERARAARPRRRARRARRSRARTPSRIARERVGVRASRASRASAARCSVRNSAAA